ncbi:MAG: hypothetical protein Q9M36_13845 [Sulfurovum sp.]|nr:hypothetical protein [Sulfurovum sp.]
MSITCPNCKNITYNESMCDKCTYLIRKPNKKKYKQSRVNKITTYKGNKIPYEKKIEKVDKPVEKNKRIMECRTCKQNISINAENCPHCGELSPQPIEKAFMNKVIVPIGFIIIVIFFIFPTIMDKVQEDIKKSIPFQQKR